MVEERIEEEAESLVTTMLSFVCTSWFAVGISLAVKMRRLISVERNKFVDKKVILNILRNIGHLATKLSHFMCACHVGEVPENSPILTFDTINFLMKLNYFFQLPHSFSENIVAIGGDTRT